MMLSFSLVIVAISSISLASMLKKLAKLDILIIGSPPSSYVAITMIKDYFLYLKTFAFFLPQRDRKLTKKEGHPLKVWITIIYKNKQ